MKKNQALIVALLIIAILFSAISIVMSFSLKDIMQTGQYTYHPGGNSAGINLVINKPQAQGGQNGG